MEKMTKIGIVENNHAYFLIYGYYFISVYLFIFIPAAGNPQHANGAMGIEQMRGIIDSTLLGSR